MVSDLSYRSWGHSAVTWGKEDTQDITNCLGLKEAKIDLTSIHKDIFTRKAISVSSGI